MCRENFPYWFKARLRRAGLRPAAVPGMRPGGRSGRGGETAGPDRIHPGTVGGQLASRRQPDASLSARLRDASRALRVTA